MLMHAHACIASAPLPVAKAAAMQQECDGATCSNTTAMRDCSNPRFVDEYGIDINKENRDGLKRGKRRKYTSKLKCAMHS